jgi:hypothetical protein
VLVVVVARVVVGTSVTVVEATAVLVVACGLVVVVVRARLVVGPDWSPLPHAEVRAITARTAAERGRSLLIGR